MNDLSISSISRNPFGSEHYENQYLTPEDIDDLIAAILNREYLVYTNAA